MALEPRTVTGNEEENPELRDMTRRLWVSVALTAPLFITAMGSMIWPHAFMGGVIVGNRRIYSLSWQPWLELILATPVVLWAVGLSFSGDGPRSSTVPRTCLP